MKIKVNGELVEIANGATINDLLQQLEMPSVGVAVASQERIVPKKLWNEYKLNPEEQITLIRATCGG